MAARLSTELQVRGETSSFGATLYTRYNELDLLPSWQLSFDPQVWESRHRSVGLLTRYRRLVAPLRTNLSTGVDLEYTPGSRLETEHRRRSVRDRCSPASPTGEVQYDYDVTFWQASPYAQADVVAARPGAAQRRSAVRPHRLRLRQPPLRPGDRLAPAARRRPASRSTASARSSAPPGSSLPTRTSSPPTARRSGRRRRASCSARARRKARWI